MINDYNYNKRYWITGVIVIVILVYIGYFFYLQVIDQSTVNLAESNTLVRQTIYPPRGLIYDRSGKLIVFNQPIYEITITLRDIKQDFDTIGFCQTIGITTDDFNNKINYIKDPTKNRGYASYLPQVFMSQLSKEDVALLQEKLHDFKGINLRKRSIRDYNYKVGAHLLGSVGEVSKNDIENDNYYTVGDYIGKNGIEKTYEKKLRGEKGVEVMLRNSKGIIEGSYNDGELDIKPQKGEALTLTIDIELQQFAEELLSGKIGSIVAIEPKTGEILTLASSPSWNPSLLIGKQRTENYKTLLNDKTKPLYNRATQAQYPPGSTFKTIQALIALEEGTVTTNTFYQCFGKTSTPIVCTHSHTSPIGLVGALEQSCNPYFWYVFRDFIETNHENEEKFTSQKKQFNKWRDYVTQFGLGKKFSNTDLAEQSSGSIPTVADYDKIYGSRGWQAITVKSLSIGQGELLVTPLQLCNVAATIANDGYYITPHLQKDSSLLNNINNISINKKHFATVKQGMLQVMTNGTGKNCQIENINMGGKTGTAQAGKYKKDHSIFIGIAPIENPQIAVAVVIENAGFGATWALPMASIVIEKYLTGEIKRKDLYDYLKNTTLNTDVKKW